MIGSNSKDRPGTAATEVECRRKAAKDMSGFAWTGAQRNGSYRNGSKGEAWTVMKRNGRAMFGYDWKRLAGLIFWEEGLTIIE
jgi:hypothetical protein